MTQEVVTHPREAIVLINGHVLSVGQSLSLRVAASTFHMELADDMLAGLGEPLRSNYRARIREVLQLMIGPLSRTDSAVTTPVKRGWREVFGDAELVDTLLSSSTDDLLAVVKARHRKLIAEINAALDEAQRELGGAA